MCQDEGRCLTADLPAGNNSLSAHQSKPLTFEIQGKRNWCGLSFQISFEVQSEIDSALSLAVLQLHASQSSFSDLHAQVLVMHSILSPYSPAPQSESGIYKVSSGLEFVFIHGTFSYVSHLMRLQHSDMLQSVTVVCVSCTLVHVSNLNLQPNTSLEIVRTEGCLDTRTFVLTTAQEGSHRKSGSRTLTRSWHQKKRQEQYYMKPDA